MADHAHRILSPAGLDLAALAALTAQPASGIETSEPAAIPSSARPSNPSPRSSLSCTAGMRTAQLPNPKPLRKNIPSTASRAAHNERPVIDLDLKRSLPPCSQTKLEDSMRFYASPFSRGAFSLPRISNSGTSAPATASPVAT